MPATKSSGAIFQFCEKIFEQLTSSYANSSMTMTLGQRIGADAAPFGGEGQRPQAELRALLDEVPGEVVGDVPLVHRHGDGAYLVAGEVARQALEGALLLGQVEFEHSAP